MKSKAKFCSRRFGCLVALLFGIAIVVWTIRVIGEPARRAISIQKRIRPGMSYDDVETMMTGRYYCFLQVQTNKEWQTFARPEFAAFLASSNAYYAARMQFHFMGMAPLRATFSVELDRAGKVTNITNPQVWD